MNEVPNGNIISGTLFPTDISRGTYGNMFYCTYFYWERSLGNNLEIRFPVNFLSRKPYFKQLFQKDSSRTIFWELVARKVAPSRNTCEKKGFLE
jgi:hypothetical protein